MPGESQDVCYRHAQNASFNEGRNERSDLADEYECDVCGETFDTEAALREHAEEEHRDEGQTFDADPELAEEPEET